jgi:hypothetical protein
MHGLVRKAVSVEVSFIAARAHKFSHVYEVQLPLPRCFQRRESVVGN